MVFSCVSEKVSLGEYFAKYGGGVDKSGVGSCVDRDR